MINLGESLVELGELDQADANYVGAVARMHDSGAWLYKAEALTNLAGVRARRGLHGEARHLARQALAIGHAYDDPTRTGTALLELARLHLADGEEAEALESAQQATTSFRRRGDRNGEAMAWHVIGEVYRSQGRLEESIAFHQRAAAVFGDLGNHWQRGIELDLLADALLQADKPSQARGHWAEALDAISGFTDREAAALRARVTLALESCRRE
jgi:tetratricopeptide (TPR) repeat protein